MRQAMLLYAGNGNYMAVSPQEADSQRMKVSQALNSVGLRTHETVHGATLVESLGVRIDGLQGRVSPTPRRDWQLVGAILALEKGATITGEEYQIIVGHMTVRAMLHRGLLSLLKHSWSGTPTPSCAGGSAGAGQCGRASLRSSVAFAPCLSWARRTCAPSGTRSLL